MRLRATRRLAVALALLAGLTLACARGGASTPRISHDYTASLTFAGLTRTYAVHLPHQYDGAHPLPLVLAFHGAGGDAVAMALLTNFNNVGEQDGFITVYPNAVHGLWSFGSSAALGGIDDVGFITALITRLRQSLRVDAARIYAVGMSDGGFFAGLLACQSADRIAAVAEVGATMMVWQSALCAPARAISMLLIHGTADPIVPFNGGILNGAGTISAPSNALRWAALDGCFASPTITTQPDLAHDGTSVVLSTYSGCHAGASVAFYAVQDGGHTWPGGPQYLSVKYIGKTTANLNASQTIWQFFAQHPLPAS